MKRFLLTLPLLVLLAASCGDSEPEVAAIDATTTTAPTTTAAPTTAAETTAAPTTAAETTEAPTADAVGYELVEWTLSGPTEIPAGSVTFEVMNVGENTHEFTIAKGDSYESLPQLANGAVDEEALGADFIGRSEKIDAGQTMEVTFDLEPGSYVFMCNIQFGPNSHASAGQVLSVTVS